MKHAMPCVSLSTDNVDKCEDNKKRSPRAPALSLFYTGVAYFKSDNLVGYF